MERGGLGHCSLSTVRQLLLALEARLEVDIRWRGGEVDRVADARHAALVAAVARVAAAAGWTVQQELTYSVYGERGSVDLVGLDRARRAVVAFEVKTELTSWEETQRRFDAKVRLLPAVLYERLGWRPTSVSQVIVFQESMTNRRRVALLGRAVRDAYPAGGREVRRWMVAPVGSISGVWFLSLSRGRTGSERGRGSHRIRRAGRPSPAPVLSVRGSLASVTDAPAGSGMVRGLN